MAQEGERARRALLLLGPSGSGRTEALAGRLAALTDGGGRPLALTCSQATMRRLRDRAEELSERGHELLVVETHRRAAERILRDHAEQAGLDPFFELVGAADRLAMLLERIDELPLRRHEIRGNPAGLLARLVARIDALKAAGITAADYAAWATGRHRAATGERERDGAERDCEFADLFARHDAIVHQAGAVDGGEAVLLLARLLAERPSLRAEICTGRALLIDELEDASASERTLIALLASEGAEVIAACDPDQARPGAPADAPGWFTRTFPGAEIEALQGSLRGGGDLADAARAVVGPVARGPAPVEDSAAARTLVRFWRCANDRAQAEAVAREIEARLSAGEDRAASICVAVPSAQADARTVGAALEERSIPYRLVGPAAFYQRPEVRDMLAWLRLLADPADGAAAVRVLTRAPIELRSVDMARCTTIARRRKLDMVSALEAALESPQIPPEARDRISGFLKLYRAAARAMGEMRADVFVRRLIERIGFRRHRLFAADPEAAERLRNLSRLAEIAAAWTRREPHGSNRDFVRYLSAVSEAGVHADDELDGPAPDAVRVIELDCLKGLEFEIVFALGLDAAAMPGPAPAGPPAVPPELTGDESRDHEAERRRALYVAMTRARRELVLSWSELRGSATARPSPYLDDARTVLRAAEEQQAEELFGPAEGLHSTYRMVRDEVLESAWRAGGTLSELRLDTPIEVGRALTRFLEMLKLAALIQRPGSESAAEAISAINELLGQAITSEQRAALAESGLDEYLLDEERERRRRRELVASREEPSLEAFLPRRGDGLALSATDISLYRTCPLKYKFARVFSIPTEQTINQRFGIAIHQVLERFHSSGGGSLERLMALFAAAWRRSGFGESDDELQFRQRAIEALRRYHARQQSAASQPVWVERGFDFRIGRHHLRGRVDRVDELPEGGYELIDYKTGDPKAASELDDDLQLAIYRLAARESWDVEARAGSYWYVLADEKVAVASSPDDAERVERTVLEVGEGIQGQDFEPRPSPAVCSWCDFRLICPAAEA